MIKAPGVYILLNAIQNELIIGLAGGLGVDFTNVAIHLTRNLVKAGYHVETIRIADHFEQYANCPSSFAECYWKMQWATKQRQIHGNDYWAKKAITQIFNLRPELSKKYCKIAYIIKSLKNKQELDLLSSVYGRNFIAISIFSDPEDTVKYLNKKLKINRLSIAAAQTQMSAINTKLELGLDIPIEHSDAKEKYTITKFLIRKDQEETHPELTKFGQNLLKCYANSNFFIYQNKNLEQQIKRFIDLLFNDPFAEPTLAEYFMFCAQAAAYRSLDLDRQVGAVIVNPEQELVAVGFNDVTKVGGGHFTSHDLVDLRDYKQLYDYNHNYLDQIAEKIAKKLHLDQHEQLGLREEISGITEFKRSTHGEMSALLDASRRGVAVRDCTMYVNTYPCHNCTKHLIASGIRKVVFLHPYTKSKAREMYCGMIEHGLFSEFKPDMVTFEPFIGVSPNRFMLTFANDKDTRLENINGKETGKIAVWEINPNSIPRSLITRQPHSYIPREWAVIHGTLPDMSSFY